MSFKTLRSVLAAVLVTAFLISLFPAGSAGAATGAIQQPAPGARPRRGKNGQPISKGTASQGVDRTTKEAPRESQQSPPVNTSSGDKDSAKAGETTRAQPVNDPFDSRSADQATRSRSGEEARRPEQPPFDRPPLNRDRDSQSGTTASESQPAQSRPSQSGPPQSGPSQTRPAGPPVLQRPPASDSRTASRPQTRVDRRDQSRVPNQDGGETGANTTTGDVDEDNRDRSSRQRPTLHRPSDGPPQSQRPAQSDRTDDRTNDGQRPGAEQQQSSDNGEVIKLESTLVNIPLLASDRSGRYIPQLGASDFTLYEDGVQQEIASFGSEEVPFSVALLLDVSPSVQGNIEAIQDAAIAFVRQLRSQDRVMVISFDRNAHFLTDFTSSRRELENAIRSISTGAGTSVYDAVFETVSRRMRSIDGRKALILFSDGEDTTSNHASYDDAINIVTESDVLVYGLRYPGGGGGNIRVDPWPRNRIPQIPFPLPFPWPWPRRRRGPFTNFAQSPITMNATATAQPVQRRRGGGGDFMADITAAGGGPVYDAEKIGDLSRLAGRIADELRHVYVLSYYPTNALSNGGYRAIRIRVRNRDDIAVRHRRGYNARDAGGAGRH
jgi:Ca-activated chloride channel homolog